MMGDKVYALFKEVKAIFDAQQVFNRGKIVDTPPMTAFLRYEQDKQKQEIPTVFDFTGQEDILRLAEKCSGSGDCRKTHITGGTMCPSYMATRNERDTTRARANMLRHYFTGKAYGTQVDVGEEEVREVLDLCLSCKACKSECPSGVDVGKMKAEFMQAYYDRKGVSFRSKLIGNYSSQMKLASLVPWGYNLVFNTPLFRRLVNKAVGFHADRTMPLLHATTLRHWYEKRSKHKKKPVQHLGYGKPFLR
jgi:Fe-S oxidoreductase